MSSSNRKIVFLSSSYEDLKEHRQAIIRSLSALRQEIHAMEFWGPSADTPLEYSLERLHESFFYIGILGTRYGTIVRDGKSMTQLEYEEASALGLQRAVYVIDAKRHPVLIRYVDVGESAQKLDAFKKETSKHLRGSFISPSDLSSQIITHLVQHLDRVGDNVRAALSEHGITEFDVDAGFFLGDMDVKMSLAEILSMPENGCFQFKDKYIESLVAAGLIAREIQNNRFKCLSGILTFRADVLAFLIPLLKIGNVNGEALANEMKFCINTGYLRLLIILAGELSISECVDAICLTLFDSINHHNVLQSYNEQITPFNDVVKSALGKMPQESIPIIRRYLDIAKSRKKWKAKRILEASIKLINRKL